MFTKLIRTLFRQSKSGSAPADPPILIDRRGTIPIYLGGVREAVQRLQPVIVRDQHRQKPHPSEQGPVGTQADRDFAGPPGPGLMVQPKWRPLDDGPLGPQPYAVDPATFGTDQATVDRATEKAMRIGPYGLGRALRD